MNHIHPRTKEAYQLFHEGALAFGRAERAGFRIDTKYCEKKLTYLDRKRERIWNKLQDTKLFLEWRKHFGAGYNPNSNDQLGKLLYDIRKIKPTRLTDKAQKGSTDEASLASLNIPELNKLLEMRKLKKIQDYLHGFTREQVNGQIHPFYNLNLVSSFRSSSDHPNFQNIPARDEEARKTCRQAIYPRKGYQLLEVDYKGIEVSVSACYHKDPNMIKYVSDPSTDMHGDMAAQIFKIGNFDKLIKAYDTLRKATKNGFVFPQFYGDYYVKNAISLACEWGKLSKTRNWRPGEGIALPEGNLADLMLKNGWKNLSQFTKYMKTIEDDF